MAENTKTPPNQDQRQRTPQSDPNKPQKPGAGMPGSNPDRGRQGISNPKPEIDPDRDRQRGKPTAPGRDSVDKDDLDDDSTQRMDRE